jgi:hypothetical protein
VHYPTLKVPKNWSSSNWSFGKFHGTFFAPRQYHSFIHLGKKILQHLSQVTMIIKCLISLLIFHILLCSRVRCFCNFVGRGIVYINIIIIIIII